MEVVMANKVIAMVDLKLLLIYKFKGFSNREISGKVGISKTTVSKYYAKFIKKGFTEDDLSKLSDLQIFNILQKGEDSKKIRYLILSGYFKYFQKELTRPGVTKQLLWLEYREKHPDGYSISQFCFHYYEWQKIKDASMHFDHKAGDELFIDYTGSKMEIFDKQTGESREVETFVGIMGCSKKIYCEFVDSQNSFDLFKCLNNTLRYMGGVPQLLVSDNLKASVTTADKYEPDLAKNMKEFCFHYKTVCDPARPLKPKDKPLVEAAVKHIYQSIYAPLRNEKFFSIEELNRRSREFLEKLNNRKLTGLEKSRNEIFDELEKELLLPLVPLNYEVKRFGCSKVSKTYHIHISLDRCYYSVPYVYIGKQINYVITAGYVEFFHYHKRISLHRRQRAHKNIFPSYITIKDHMPANHRYVSSWSREKFVKEGEKVGPNTALYIEKIYDEKGHPHPAHKACMGILKLGKKGQFGKERLESSCIRALKFKSYSLKTIKSILNKNLDKFEISTQSTTIPVHKNIRGDYK